MIKNILLLSLFVKLYSFFYPDEFIQMINKCKVYYELINPYVINVTYNIIWAYSYCQIKYNKLYSIVFPKIKFICTQINTFLENKNLISKGKEIKTIVSYYNHGDLVKQESFIQEVNNLQFSTELADHYDLIAISDLKCPKNSIYFINGYLDSIDFSHSNIKFISLECSYKDKKYNIELKNNKVNFYINNFVIDSKFIKYYIKNILNCKDDINDDKKFEYTLQLIDHNVVITELDHNKSIIILENSYIIGDNCSNKNKQEIINLEEEKEENDKEENDKEVREHSLSEDFIKLE